MTVKDQLKIFDRKIRIRTDRIRLIMICVDKMQKYLL